MTKQDKENLQNKKLTDTLLLSCLAACEPIISKNAYLEKKWANCGQSYNGCYQYERQLWMEYREKIRSVLLPIYSMKMIIQMTKGCKDKATQKEVLQKVLTKVFWFPTEQLAVPIHGLLPTRWKLQSKNGKKKTVLLT